MTFVPDFSLPVTISTVSKHWQETGYFQPSSTLPVNIRRQPRGDETQEMVPGGLPWALECLEGKRENVQLSGKQFFSSAPMAIEACRGSKPSSAAPKNPPGQRVKVGPSSTGLELVATSIRGFQIWILQAHRSFHLEGGGHSEKCVSVVTAFHGSGGFSVKSECGSVHKPPFGAYGNRVVACFVRCWQVEGEMSVRLY